MVIGGFVVRDPTLTGLRRALPVRGLLRRRRPLTRSSNFAAPDDRSTGLNVPPSSAFGEDGAGHLYARQPRGQRSYRLGRDRRHADRDVAHRLRSTSRSRVGTRPGDTTRLFVAEKAGRVRIALRTARVSDPSSTSAPVRHRHGGEQGLLVGRGRARLRDQRALFVYYTDNGGDIRIDEFRRTGEAPDRGPRHPPAAADDPAPSRPKPQRRPAAVRARQLLYLSTGDGGSRATPEATPRTSSSLLGKILRIDVGIPPAAAGRTPPRPAAT